MRVFPCQEIGEGQGAAEGEAYEGNLVSFPSEESPDSIGRTTGEISAGVTLGKCHREKTADGPRNGHR